jgi:hypothetical protein
MTTRACVATSPLVDAQSPNNPAVRYGPRNPKCCQVYLYLPLRTPIVDVTRQPATRAVEGPPGRIGKMVEVLVDLCAELGFRSGCPAAGICTSA